MRIMIVEDDAKLRRIMGECLQKYGYELILAEDFKNIEQQFEKEKPDMAILDINLPYYDGYYLCRIFRRKSKIPILIVSARSGETEQMMGIELGADDYITKPFNMELFSTKVKAALRRSYGEYSGIGAAREVGGVAGINLDEDSFRIRYGGMSADLSKNEFRLVRKLIENHDRIVSREDLLAELWDDSSFVDDNTLTVNVTRVKSKLADLGISNVIRTKRGTGYIFDTVGLEGGENV